MCSNKDSPSVFGIPHLEYRAMQRSNWLTRWGFKEGLSKHFKFRARWEIVQILMGQVVCYNYSILLLSCETNHQQCAKYDSDCVAVRFIDTEWRIWPGPMVFTIPVSSELPSAP